MKITKAEQRAIDFISKEPRKTVCYWERSCIKHRTEVKVPFSFKTLQSLEKKGVIAFVRCDNVLMGFSYNIQKQTFSQSFDSLVCVKLTGEVSK